MRPWALLPLLEKHPNLGCYPEFGQAGTIITCNRVLDLAGESFHFDIRPDVSAPAPGANSLQAVVPASELRRKGIATDMIYRLVGSRVFVSARTGNAPGRIFFLHEPEEVMALLRANLEFLSHRNDRASRELRAKLVQVREESRWADENLCQELHELRKESVEHVRRLLRKSPERRKLVEALDRGEALDFLKSKPRGARDSSPLTLRDISYLVSVVRARYVLEILQRRTAAEGARLTPLGEKLFGRAAADSFSPSEVDQLFLLARRAFEKPLSANVSLAHLSESLVTV